ncbi:penicillin-binding protein 2 [Lipingzhangella sp. LS1_29]|uniref:Penicillin-binding protein 2 n=1 Tax=Lipingzhangella rawalii TaxID=2055835 RepID=A0ABU2HAP1_9ACTN|nr:penicillin-binding protein 2 [Lipingzhangella rawalii]MDS1271654.1 penicillin-binding protein 2 [Lipingzhangella rawalii]
MNIPIRRLTVFLMVLFAALLLQVNWLQAITAESLREADGNPRVNERKFDDQRGPIIVADEQIAYSEETGEDALYDYQRVYEDSEYFAHVTGFFSFYNETGIERAENSLLDGSDSRLAVRNFMDMISGEESQGASAHLTLHPDAQRAAVDGLRQFGDTGAAVALDPSTGEILTAASIPTFDANPISSLDTEVSGQAMEELDARLEEDNPLLNRAFNERYPPGSTFKIVTAAAALENGASPDSEMAAPDSMELGGTLRNAGGMSCNGGNPDTLANSIKISCNTSFANWAMELGAEQMYEQASAFGFNQGPLEVPLDVTESLAPNESDDEFVLARSGIGQGNLEATPLQMAMVASGIANNGDVMRPYLVDSVQAPDLSEITSTDPEVYMPGAVSSSTASDLTEMMKLVTEEGGTGTNAAISGIDVAGKTGTAQAGGDRANHSWYIGFAPADDPEVAVATVIEHGGGGGGASAAPVARDIMEAVLQE